MKHESIDLMNKIFIFFIMTNLLICCSVVQKAAVNTTADIAENGQREIQTMNSWEAVKAAIPAQIAFAETLSASSTTNTTLITQLIKGNSALGFIIYETEILIHAQDSKKKKYFTDQASFAYSRAVNWGEKFFAEKNIKWNELLIGVNDENKLYQLLDNNLDEDDLPAVFFTGQAWASLINLNRDQVKLVNHLPVARNLIQYVCKKNPDFEKGMCILFEAMFQISRPKMLGGNPDLGKKLFQDVMKKYPNNLLYAVSYLQYYVIPQKIVSEFKNNTQSLGTQLQAFENSQKFPRYITHKSEFSNYPENNLYNLIANLRFQSMLQNKQILK